MIVERGLICERRGTGNGIIKPGLPYSVGIEIVDKIWRTECGILTWKVVEEFWLE
jgi:hypothetical protein